jgi:membrane fusion protein (multidrug efflux system)
VPLNAIYRLPGTGEDFVFVVQQDNTVKRKPVKRVTTRGTLVLVKGVKANQTLATDGKNKLSDGSNVHLND